MKIKRIFISLSVITVLFALPATAIASSSAQSGYEESAPLGSVGEAGNNGTTGQATSPVPGAVQESSSSSVLPFTGLQLAIVFLLGVALLAAGVLVRRASRSAGP